MRKLQLRSLPLVLAVSLLTVVPPFGSVADAEQRAYAISGMFGLSDGQTARIYLAHAARPRDPACEADLLFVDKNGRALTTRAVSVGPQAAAYYDLPHAGAKTPVRAVALVDGRTCKRRNLLLSVEVFDTASGEALFVPPNPVIPPNPIYPPDPQ